MLAGLGSLLLAVLIVAFVAGRDDSREATVAPDPSLAIDATPAATHVDAAVVSVVVPADASAPRLPAADAAVPLDASVLAPRPPPPPAPPVVQAPGVLVVVVKPWATLWIDGKQVGETPYRVSLPAGRHRLRLVNEERGKSEWATVTITPGRTTTIERNW
jgi:serine/threonine-protein kinase